MLIVENLHANINPNFSLGPLSFTAQEGQIIVILGENGSGKTSLFRALLAEISAQGTATLNHLNLQTSKLQERAQQVSLVPQIETVPFHFTVKETVLMGCLPFTNQRWEDEHDHTRADESLEALKINHLKDRFIHELSGGERQKTLIARSLMQNPNLLLLDEPTSHVDLKTRANLQNLIPELTESRITLVTTHDLAWGSAIADRCIVMQDGKIVADQEPQNLDSEKLSLIFETNIESIKTKTGRTIVRPVD